METHPGILDSGSSPSSSSFGGGASGLQLSLAGGGVGFRTPAEVSYAQKSGNEMLDLHPLVLFLLHRRIVLCDMVRKRYFEPFLRSEWTAFEP